LPNTIFGGKSRTLGRRRKEKRKIGSFPIYAQLIFLNVKAPELREEGKEIFCSLLHFEEKRDKRGKKKRKGGEGEKKTTEEY